MKLKLISEIQIKSSDTSLERSNITGSLKVNSVNDLYHKKNKKKRKQRLK
jgi:hypothetical protein